MTTENNDYRQYFLKRIGNLIEKIADMDNLRLADKNARKGKPYSREMLEHDRHAEENLQRLRQQLLSGTFKTSKYFFFTIKEPKERVIAKLPYYPDRIVHHAIVNVLSPIWLSVFTADTYACIKGRGIHQCAKKVRDVLKKDREGTKYCLKLDIKKFYPSTSHKVLKDILRRKIKDKLTLVLLDEIIDSVDDPGVPIGNYISQWLENLLLSYMDHWIKEVLKVKYYFRYADDIVIFSDDKEKLHTIRKEIGMYLSEKLELELKNNYQVFPVDARGLDFVGYVFRHGYTHLRKNIKQRMMRKVYKLTHRKNGLTIKIIKRELAPWYGWCKHCNSRHLLKKAITTIENTYPTLVKVEKKIF